MTDTQDTPFDPADHTVADVLEYVKEHPEQAEDVAALEAEGKGRQSLLEALSPAEETPVESEPEPEPEPAVAGDVRTYELQPGDNPSRVAREVYGRGSFGGLIVKANPGVKWKPGVQVVIPEA